MGGINWCKLLRINDLRTAVAFGLKKAVGNLTGGRSPLILG
jgi:hypothetical protein